MKIILVSHRHRSSRTFHLNSGWRRATAIVALALPLVAAWGGYAVGHAGSNDPQGLDRQWHDVLLSQQREIDSLQQQANTRLQALTVRLAELQAGMLRIDAVGERVTRMAKLDSGEFDFSQPPAVGGPEEDSTGDAVAPPAFMSTIDRLGRQIADRQQQLEVLESLLANRRLSKEVTVSGWPIKKGWISSGYGYRIDPFTGKRGWHPGIDFAGKLGSPVIAVAAGVVTWAAKRGGYGNLVEINHGNGLVTRYGHNKKLLVHVGDVVKKGQEIALMGSTGRSTGPHCHFEVYKNGRPVNPKSYIMRASR